MKDSMAAKFQEDRWVKVTRLEGGGAILEWCSPQPDNGAAYQSTIVKLSRDAYHATAQVLSLMVLEEIEDAKNQHQDA